MRTLVVEDERGLAEDIAEGLRDHGIAVDVAYDGLDAAAKINLYPYDVIVLDRDLPGLHGDSICRLVADTDNPAMILMLTAAGSPGERVAGLQLGADDYLAKPFHFPELVLRIHALAAASQPRPTASSAPPGSSSTPSGAQQPATAGRSTSAQRSSPFLTRCSKPAPARSPPSNYSSKPGTRTSTPSPAPSTSPSLDSRANSETPHPSSPRRASATASPPAADSRRRASNVPQRACRRRPSSGRQRLLQHEGRARGARSKEPRIRYVRVRRPGGRPSGRATSLQPALRSFER